MAHRGGSDQGVPAVGPRGQPRCVGPEPRRLHPKVVRTTPAQGLASWRARSEEVAPRTQCSWDRKRADVCHLQRGWMNTADVSCPCARFQKVPEGSRFRTHQSRSGRLPWPRTLHTRTGVVPILPRGPVAIHWEAPHSGAAGELGGGATWFPRCHLGPPLGRSSASRPGPGLGAQCMRIGWVS